MPRERVPPPPPPPTGPGEPNAANTDVLGRYTRLIVLRTGGDGDADQYVGRIPAIPGCYVIGRDRDEVLDALSARGRERLEHLLLAGEPLPEPDLPPGFEGLVIDRTE